jgi:hypothetical protein
VPEGALVIAPNGVLYGTTQGGGAYGLGSVFELTKPTGQPWKETVLHSFSGSDGQYPESTLVFGSSGVLYGTTLGGNGVAGTIFQMAPPSTSGAAWTLTVLHPFPYNSDDGQNFSPNGAVLPGPGGTLYATTQGPGSPELGLAIALAPPSRSGGDSTEYQLYSFAGAADGGGPLAGVVSEGGSLFGTAASGGEFGCNEFGCGVVFQLTPGPTHGTAWTESVLHTFGETPDDGAGPFAALTVGPGGALYGTTRNGGSGSACQANAPNCGTVFQLVPPASSGGAWTYSVLYNFTGTDGDGAAPVAGITVGANGVLYGTTESGGSTASYSACPGGGHTYPGCGILFQLTPPSTLGGTWTETVLHSFSGQNGDGAIPVAGLVLSSGGVLYGTTSAGGTAGKGTAFAIEP